MTEHYMTVGMEAKQAVSTGVVCLVGMTGGDRGATGAENA